MIASLQRRLTRVEIGRGVVDLRWHSPGFGDDMVLPPEATAVVVAIAKAARNSRSAV